jgi:hypothetical protein
LEEISQDEKDQVFDLVKSQKKAKIIWVSTVTEIPVEKIAVIAKDFGFIIEEEYILAPKDDDDVHSSTETEYSYSKPIRIVRESKVRKILLIILAIFMILALIPAALYGGILTICSFGSGGFAAAFMGVFIVIIGLASCISGIAILINQWNR